jgi:hypothetical protein
MRSRVSIAFVVAVMAVVACGSSKTQPIDGAVTCAEGQHVAKSMYSKRAPPTHGNQPKIAPRFATMHLDASRAVQDRHFAKMAMCTNAMPLVNLGR